MYKKGQLISGMVMYTIIILVISKLATNSLNPIEVFRGDSLLLKIVVGFLGGLILLSVVGYLFSGVVAEKSCAKDGLPLGPYADAYGKPVRCNFCQRWFHGNCFKSKGGTMMTGCKQEGCPTAIPEF